MSPITSLHIARYKPRQSFWKLLTLLAEQWELKSTPGISFGTVTRASSSRTTRVRGNTANWAIFAVWESDQARLDFLEHSPLMARWRRYACSIEHFTLEALSSQGTWGGIDPFDGLKPSERHVGEVALFTHASLSWTKAMSIRRDMRVVDKALRAERACSFAVGMNEWPRFELSTFSLWNSGDDAREFAFGDSSHARAIQRVRSQESAVEEMFSRFKLIDRRRDAV